LTGYDNPKYTNRPTRDSILAGKVLTDGKINGNGRYNKDGSQDTTHLGAWRAGGMSLNEYYHSNGHFRSGVPIKDLGLPENNTWHEDLIGYKKGLPNNDNITDEKEEEEEMPTDEAINAVLGFGESENGAERDIKGEPESVIDNSTLRLPGE
jgi:hypothetical protein